MIKGKALLGIFFFLLMASLLTACGAADDCKSCSIVKYDGGGEISRTSGVLYCGDELAEKESTPPVTVLGVTTVWECN